MCPKVEQPTQEPCVWSTNTYFGARRAPPPGRAAGSAVSPLHRSRAGLRRPQSAPIVLSDATAVRAWPLGCLWACWMWTVSPRVGGGQTIGIGRVPLHPCVEGRRPCLKWPPPFFLLSSLSRHVEDQFLNDNRCLFPCGGIKRQSFKQWEGSNPGKVHIDV